MNCMLGSYFPLLFIHIKFQSIFSQTNNEKEKKTAAVIAGTLRGIYTLSGEVTLSNVFCLPSERGLF